MTKHGFNALAELTSLCYLINARETDYEKNSDEEFFNEVIRIIDEAKSNSCFEMKKFM